MNTQTISPIRIMALAVCWAPTRSTAGLPGGPGAPTEGGAGGPSTVVPLRDYPQFSVRRWTRWPPHKNSAVAEREVRALVRAGLPE